MVMEKNNDLSALRPRSSQAAISAGYRLFVSNFKHLFRASWLLAVIYALTMGVFACHFFQNVLPLLYQSNGLTGNSTTLVIGGALLLLFILIAAAFASVGFHAMSVHKDTGAIPRPARWYGLFHAGIAMRTIVSALWIVATVTVATAVLVGVSYGMKQMTGVSTLTDSVTSMTVLAVVTILILTAALPLAYSVVSGIVFKKKFGWRTPVEDYGKGIRHLGKLFLIALVVVIVTLLLTFVGQMPGHVLTIAHLLAQAGHAQGDPLGMPDNIGLITFGVFTLTGFIQAYIHLSTIFPFYYAVGGEEQNQQTATTTT